MANGTGRFQFAAGAVLASLAYAIVAAALVVIVGPSRVGRALGLIQDSVIIDIPSGVKDELIRLGAQGENFSGLDSGSSEPTFFTVPDERLPYRLRPNVTADVFVMTPRGNLNLDPPAIQLPADAPLSAAAREYLDRSSRLRFRYSTTAEGFRVTVPVVQSERRVLMVSDSVGFGVGVDDDDTVASELQRLLGSSVQVSNAGRPGFQQEDVLTVAEQATAERRYDTVIYLACHNDFPIDLGQEALRKSVATGVERFSNLRGRAGRLVMFLVTPLEYEARDVLLSSGLSDGEIVAIERTRAWLREDSERAGIEFGDWSPIARASIAEQGTIFAPFAMYADRTHLSPAGNRLLARALAELFGPVVTEPRGGQ